MNKITLLCSTALTSKSTQTHTHTSAKPRRAQEIILTQFEFVRFFEELFRAHHNRKLLSSESSSRLCRATHCCCFNIFFLFTFRMHAEEETKASAWLGWLVFPNSPTAYHLIIIYYGILQACNVQHTHNKSERLALRHTHTYVHFKWKYTEREQKKKKPRIRCRKQQPAQQSNGMVILNQPIECTLCTIPTIEF